MPFLRIGALVATASILVTGWMTVQRHVEAAFISHPSTVTRPGVTYYVSPSGNDAASGKSPQAAWRTLARASAAVLRPGDRLLLQGHQRFPGQLTIDRSDGGNATRHVRIGTYGRGRATIISSSNGILIYDSGGVTISNLVITGQRAMNPRDAGVQLYSDLTRKMAGHVTITHVDVSGFGTGISIGARHDNAGFRDVSVTYAVLHGNLDAGLASYGPPFIPAAPAYANQNIYIAHVQAFRNLGDPHDLTANSGNGIVLGSVRNATLVRSSAHDNGGSGGARHEGPEGIWAYNSTRVVIAHDVAYDNRSRSAADGGGFGLDLNTSASVLEYDLSYHNHGSGFLVFGTRRSPQTGNTVRFNISFGDARGSGPLGGITVGGARRTAVYQNTVVMTRASSKPALRLSGQPRGDTVLDNIFVASPGGEVVRAVHSYTRSDVRLAGNDYLASPGSPSVIWGPLPCASLARWRTATGQELVNGKPTGLVARPSFVGPQSGSAKGGAGFRLGRRSRLRHAGLDLRLLFHLRPGPVNFAGKPYPVRSPDVGAW